ncbi:hypothetical protein AB0M39_33495 [Streptomyces sp. NPDC051907]|uniref:hypothetical protein n=1 Tax=Streptomyces sp. NPDC051907 TaxID=3155284 RepID=UPI003413A874
MPDYIYSAAELGRALYVYAASVARLLKPIITPRFRLLAGRLPSGVVVGAHEWHKSTETGLYIPSTEPWVVWDELDERVTLAA